MLHGQVRYHVPSRFVDEIPRNFVQWLSARAQRRALDAGGAEWGARWARPQSEIASRASVPADAAAGAWRIGQSVRHAKFGVGVIVDAEGRGNDARVQVNFRDAGVKWLSLEYAKLEAA
jgi:DNA helicase-2/ATP-dependent DNA helicase PcrA